MPVRRRVAKHRDTQPAWELVFLAGYDFFKDLPAIGVETDAYDRPSRKDTMTAWAKFGRAYLEEYSDRYVEPWALREFGEPGRQNASSQT